MRVYIYLLASLLGLSQAAPLFGGSLEAGRVERGKAIYQGLCISCHGEDGSGKGPGRLIRGAPPTDLSDKAYMSLLTDEELFDRIAYGEDRFPFLMMPGWISQLSPEDIRDVIAYIRTLEKDKGPLRGPTPQEKERRFRTDPLERGRIYYTKFCSSCHGEEGKGNGWASKNLPARPADLTSLKLTRKRLVDYVRGNAGGKDRRMLIFSKKLSDRVIDEILLYIERVLKGS